MELHKFVVKCDSMTVKQGIILDFYLHLCSYNGQQEESNCSPVTKIAISVMLSSSFSFFQLDFSLNCLCSVMFLKPLGTLFFLFYAFKFSASLVDGNITRGNFTWELFFLPNAGKLVTKLLRKHNKEDVRG